jgi:integrase
MGLEELMEIIRTSGIPANAVAAALTEESGRLAPKAETRAGGIATQAQAEAAPPGTWRAKGATGLYLAKREGSGSWHLRFWLNGKRREMGLGALKDVKLAEAKDKALKLRAELKGGADPIAARQAARAEAAVEGDKWDFVQAAESYLDAHAPSWKHPRARQVWHGPLVKYVYPVIGAMKLDAIRVEHVDAVMTAAVAGGAPQVAPRIRLRIEQILNAAAALGRRNAELPNPANVKLVRAVRPAKREDNRENFRRIPLDAAPAAFQRLIGAAQASTALSALAFMILTASRPSEALCAEWSEIDFEKRLWTISAARMKGGKEHVVPLSDAALAILDRRRGGRCVDAVFPGLDGSQMSYGAFSSAARGLEFDVGTPHSWRSIFRDTVEDKLGFPPHLAEAALSHSLGKVAAAYRRETAVEARRGLMDAYARWLWGRGSQRPRVQESGLRRR